MGSRIGAASSAGMSQSQGINNWQQRQQNVSALNSALQSGDLGAAQKAYSTLAGNGKNVNPSSPLGQIGTALQSGDLGAAKQAAQALRGGHHGHHAAANVSPGVAPATVATAPGTGSLINTTA